MSDDTPDNVRRLPRRSRDERIADEAHADRSLLCGAHGCPNRWSVDAGNGRLCSAHAWAGRHLWPQVTQEQQDAETERAWRNANRSPQPEDHPRHDPARLARALSKLSQAKGPIGWAKRLRWCEQERGGRLPSGQPMTQFQRDAWRQVLRDQAEAVDDADAVRARAFPPEFPAPNGVGVAA